METHGVHSRHVHKTPCVPGLNKNAPANRPEHTQRGLFTLIAGRCREG